MTMYFITLKRSGVLVRLWNERGRLTAVKWVFGGIERGTGKCFMVQVESGNAETLLPLIQEWIGPGTHMHDGWGATNDIHLLPDHYP